MKDLPRISSLGENWKKIQKNPKIKVKKKNQRNDDQIWKKIII